MRLLRNLALAAALGVAVTGCDDDFLTTVPTDRISDETFWQTQEDFTLAINAAYRNVVGLDQMYFDGAADIAYSQQYWMRNAPYARGTHDALTGWHGGLWGGLYAGISKANEVIHQVEQTEMLDAAQADRILGQALFLRGYFYHELLWLFGEVPLLTTVPTPQEAREATRASRDAVLDQILSDLNTAANLLPESWPSSEQGRATKGAALAYQARAALYEATWQEYRLGNNRQDLYRTAADAAQAVMELGVYDLYPDFRDLFTYAGEGSSEVIFDYQILSGENGWWAWVGFAPSSMGGNADVTPTRAMVDAFYMTDGLLPENSPLYDPTPPTIDYSSGEPVVTDLGMYANRDPRLYATVLFPGASFNGTIYNSLPDSPTGDRLDPGNFFNTHTGYMPLKYVTPVDQPNPWDSGLNMIKMRYGDVLLMYAEAKIELGEIDGTVTGAINQLRDRVGMPHVSAGSQQEMLDLVRNERIVELAWEGLRLADIRRWDIAEDVMPGRAHGIDYYDASGNIQTAQGEVVRLFTAPRDYLWPIPASELDLNTEMRQNPGY